MQNKGKFVQKKSASQNAGIVVSSCSSDKLGNFRDKAKLEAFYINNGEVKKSAEDKVRPVKHFEVLNRNLKV